MTTDTQPSPPFTDPKNITVGKARVIWVKAIDYRPEGWVLPGGLRTQNFAEAHGVAVAMNQIMGGK